MSRFQHNRKEKGPMGRAVKGKTAGGASRGWQTTNKRKKKIGFDGNDDDSLNFGGILGSLGSSTLSSDLDSISKQNLGGSNKSSKRRRTASKKAAGPNPLELAQMRQGQLSSNRASSFSDTSGYRIPRKTGRNRRPNESPPHPGREASRRRRQLQELDQQSQSPSSLGRAVNFASQMANKTANAMTKAIRDKFDRRSNESKSNVVVNLCDSSDDEANSQRSFPSQQSGQSSPREDSPRAQESSSIAATLSSNTSTSTTSVQDTSNRAESSPREGSPRARESLSSAATLSSKASTSTTRSGQDMSNPTDSSEDEELELVDSRVTISRGAMAQGTSDLWHGQQEGEEEAGGPNVCNVLNEIGTEAYGGDSESKPKARKPTSRKQPAATAPRASARNAPNAATPSALSWGSTPMPKQRKQGTYSFSKVNAKKKRKTTPIEIGSSIRPSPDPTHDDPIIEDSDSDVEEVRQHSRLARMDAAGRTTGVQRNPYAKSKPDPPQRTSRSRRRPAATTIQDSDSDISYGEDFGTRIRASKTTGGIHSSPLGRRKSHPRAAKARNADLHSDGDNEYEFDTTALASPGNRAVTKSKSLDAVRIAIGKKIFANRCTVRYRRTSRKGRMILCYDDKNGVNESHEIDLDDASIHEIKYCLAKDDEDGVEKPISIDFDESEQMSFLAMHVEPNDANGLSKFPNAYRPTSNEDGSELAANKRYIAIEFRSDTDFLKLLQAMKKDETLSAFVGESSKLKSFEVEEYGSSLLEAARNERAARESSIGSPRLRRTRKKKRGSRVSNEVVLVFPFGADENKIDKAAEGLQEAGHSGIEVGGIGAQPSEGGSAALKSGDDESRMVTDTSDDSGAAGADADSDEKDDPAGKTKSRAHFLTIRDEDCDRLQPGEFLNDTLIDFWFQWIWRKERHADTDVHFFTSHFYSALAKGGPKAVTSWTAKKNIDVFTKKFIFIPINQSLHWSLCVVVNAGHIRNEIEDCNIETDDNSRLPCLFFFDSLKAHKRNLITKNIRLWLNSEWLRLEKAQEDYEREPFDKNTMQVYSPRVPYQDNSWDCGVFVCRYGFGIYLLRGGEVTYAHLNDNFRTLVTESEEFNFDRTDIVRIRKELSALIQNLSTLYIAWKKDNDKAEKKADEESKKPAARRLLLENGDATATGEQGQVSSTLQHGTTATDEAKESSADEWDDDAKPSPVDAAVTNADVGGDEPSKPDESNAMEVEMAEAAGGGNASEETAETLQSTIAEGGSSDLDEPMEELERVEDEVMEEATEPAVKIRMEEDQFGEFEI